MSRLRAFGAFLWDFVVGDDWRVAVAVVFGLGVTALISGARVAAWWLMPLVVVAILGLSLRSAARPPH